MKEIKIKIAGNQYKVEVAETDLEHEKGLQGKESLDSDKGMLFVFEDEQNRSFWMKNTSIPLDIIFIDEELNVTVVHQGQPESTEMLDGICSYVLEINQGSNVQSGDELEFEPETESEKINKMLVLNSAGQIQMELEGGERIMSRPHTKTLIKFAKKAATTNNDNDYKALGKRLFKFLQVQMDTPAEYVEGKKDVNEEDENENETN